MNFALHPIPISATYLACLGLLLIGLSARVVMLRASTGTDFGDDDGGAESALSRAIRAQANFTEYVPVGILVLVILELAGTSAAWLHGLGGTLVVGRVLHAVGLSRNGGPSVSRGAGLIATWIEIGVGSGLALFGALAA